MKTKDELFGKQVITRIIKERFLEELIKSKEEKNEKKNNI